MALFSLLKVKTVSLRQLKSMAKDLEIDVEQLKVNDKINKSEFIRTIQTAEGNYPCFGTAQGYCSQEDCIFRGDCLN